MTELMHNIWMLFLAGLALMLAMAGLFIVFRIIMLGYDFVKWIEDGILAYLRSRKYLEDKVKK